MALNFQNNDNDTYGRGGFVRSRLFRFVFNIPEIANVATSTDSCRLTDWLMNDSVVSLCMGKNLSMTCLGVVVVALFLLFISLLTFLWLRDVSSAVIVTVFVLFLFSDKYFTTPIVYVWSKSLCMRSVDGDLAVIWLWSWWTLSLFLAFLLFLLLELNARHWTSCQASLV